MILHGYQVFDQVNVTNGQQEDEQPEDDKIFGGIAERLAVIGSIPVPREDKRLEGVTERLREHHHDDGDLEVLTVDTQLSKSICFVGINPWEDDLVHGLVKDTCDAKDKDGE